ncbi:MAG: metal ABC transporter permease [Veillonella sp.]|nr:metal ABC transporter permease [Veillonella sp.]
MTLLQSYTTQMVLLGTALLGLASGIAGTFAVLRKESLIGDGLSHAALPGVVIAFLLTGIKDIEVLIAGAALSSITAAWLITITVENSKIKFDGALATILSAFFGLGMVLLTYVQSLNNAGQAGLSKFIFGQAATILARDVYITSAAALIIIVLTALFWKELKLISFDVEYAKTLQIPVTFTLILYRSLLIMTIIIGIQSVGAILISSLLIAPAVGARQWTNKLGTMCILAGFFGMISAIGGTIWSTSVPKLPTGPAIIVILSILVLLSLIFAPNRGMLWQFRKNRRSKHASLLETTRAPKSKAQQSIYVAEDAQPRIGGAP